MKATILRECLRLSRSKIYKHHEREHWIHFSYIVQNNKILSAGTNNSHHPPIHLGYSRRLAWEGSHAKTHSEFDCWKSARGIIDKSRNWEIVNVRTNKVGAIRNSAPCNCCNAFLSEMGCVRCFYTTNECFLDMKMG